MPVIQNSELRKVILEKYKLAKSSILSETYEFSQDVSNNIPGYDINKLQFGAYKKDRFVSFFADMRESTKRAKKIGAKDTFLTIHAIMPAMIYVVQAYGGSIIDLPGDGVMALFKGNREEIHWRGSQEFFNEESLAVSCGQDLLKAFKEVVNPILTDDEIDPVDFGVGIDTGEVIVTKVGTDKIRDVKAIGNCINDASKNSFGNNEIFISPNTYQNIDDRLRKGFKSSCRPEDEVEGFLKKID